MIYVIAYLLYVYTTGENSDLDVTFTKIFFLILTLTVQLLPMGIQLMRIMLHQTKGRHIFDLVNNCADEALFSFGPETNHRGSF